MYTKYPRTPHFPWSPGKTRDDRVMNDPHKNFNDKLVVASVKMDGENTTMYKDYIHARSIDSKDHESRHWIKNLHNQIKHDLPEDTRICGENLYAKHSIHYRNLKSYFYVYSIWDNEYNVCLSYDITKMVCETFALTCVPKLYLGVWNEDTPNTIEKLLADDDEGYVVRLYHPFYYDDFETSVAKYVREDHVQTDEHWMHQKIVRNELRKIEEQNV